MSTSLESKTPYQKAFVPTTALAKQVDFDDVIDAGNFHGRPRPQRATALVSTSSQRYAEAACKLRNLAVAA